MLLHIALQSVWSPGPEGFRLLPKFVEQMSRAAEMSKPRFFWQGLMFKKALVMRKVESENESRRVKNDQPFIWIYHSFALLLCCWLIQWSMMFFTGLFLFLFFFSIWWMRFSTVVAGNCLLTAVDFLKCILSFCLLYDWVVWLNSHRSLSVTW